MYSDAVMAAMVTGMPSLVVTIRMLLRHRERMAKQDALPQGSVAGIEPRSELEFRVALSRASVYLARLHARNRPP